MTRTRHKTEDPASAAAKPADRAPGDASSVSADRSAIPAGDAMLRGVLSAAPIGIGVVRNRVIGWTNRRMTMLLGYEAGELEGKSARLLYETDEEYERVGRVKHAEVRRTGTGTIETRMVCKDGEVIDVLLSSSAIDNDDLGAGLVFTVMDTTEHARGEERRRRLAAAIEQTAEAIVIFDRSARIEYVNAAFERITGYGSSEAIGRLPVFLESGAHDQAFYQRMWNTLLSGKPFHARLVNRKKNGELVEVEASIAPLVSESGEITGYIEVMRDITREIQLERQLRQAQKMEAVGQLAGGIAHDFNNLLQVILGHADLAAQEILPEEQASRDIEQILLAGRRASILVSHLLAFSRRQPIQPRVVEIDEQIAGLAPMLHRLISEDIELEFVAGAGDGRVFIDPGEIEQILINLVINARDAMTNGGRLLVGTRCVTPDAAFREAHPDATPGDYALVEVVDTGIGMSPAVMERIFEPFFSTKEIDKGTGLGLSTVYGIVKRHEGVIEVESVPGRGTTFRVHLPLTDREPAPEPEAMPVATEPATGGTILVAEDQPQVLSLAVKVLRRAGYEVITARDGEEALDRFEKHAGDIDLLVLDVVMPKKSGTAVHDEVRRRRSDVPIIFSSGYSFDEEGDRRLPAGVPIIQKPYTPGTLLESIRAILG